MHTITKAKAAINVDEKISESIADFVADTVTENIYNTVEKISAASMGAHESLARLEAEIQSLKSAKVPNVEGVGGLVAKRDHLKNLAQKKYDHLNIVMRSAQEVRAESKSNDVTSDKKSKDEMMSEIFGSTYEQIVASKAKYEEFKKKQTESNSSASDRETFVSNIDALKAKKIVISEKMKELEIEMKRLSMEQEKVEKELIEEQDKLVVYDNSLSEEAKEAEKVMVEVTKTMKLNDSVSLVVDTLQEFRNEMDKMTSSEMESLLTNMATIDLTTELPPQFQSYLELMNDYFYSEWNLVSFLQNRAHNLRAGFPRLVRRQIVHRLVFIFLLLTSPDCFFS